MSLNPTSINSLYNIFTKEKPRYISTNSVPGIINPGSIFFDSEHKNPFATEIISIPLSLITLYASLRASLVLKNEELKVLNDTYKSYLSLIIDDSFSAGDTWIIDCGIFAFIICKPFFAMSTKVILLQFENKVIASLPLPTPTLIIFKNGEVFDTLVGLQDKTELLNKLKSAL